MFILTVTLEGALELADGQGQSLHQHIPKSFQIVGHRQMGRHPRLGGRRRCSGDVPGMMDIDVDLVAINGMLEPL